MKTTLVPSADRLALGFEGCVRSDFAFLESKFQYRILESDFLHVVYASPPMFVDVYHGNLSYEMNVELGRWLVIDGKQVRQHFPLFSFINVLGGDGDPAKPLVVTNPEFMGRVVSKMAILTEEYLPQLNDVDEVFKQLTRANSKWFGGWQDGIQASRLREQADRAWHEKDYRNVVTAYEEIDTDLHTIDLRPSERARLAYARKHRHQIDESDLGVRGASPSDDDLE